MNRFLDWLATTQGSIALHNSLYVYLLVSTVHVVTLSLFVGTAAMLDLRLLGATMRDVPVSEVAGRLRPWTIAGFLVMAASGALLFYANPTPRYENFFFRTKMMLLVLAGVNAWLFHRTVYRRVVEWDRDPLPPLRARVAGGVALALWAATIMSGRMVAYDFFDCRRQPQPAIVNLVSGCVTDPR
jgi:Family of unknown function (DUF6644)